MIVVGGTFVQNGIGTIAALGGVLVLPGVGGLAHLASETEAETVTTHTTTETTTEDSEPMHGGTTSGPSFFARYGPKLLRYFFGAYH